jgi:hypothetical protein
VSLASVKMVSFFLLIIRKTSCNVILHDKGMFIGATIKDKHSKENSLSHVLVIDTDIAAGSS